MMHGVQENLSTYAVFRGAELLKGIKKGLTKACLLRYTSAFHQ